MLLQKRAGDGILQAMLKMRLQRIGKPGHAYFRLVLLEHTTKAKGKYLELLGSYDPHKKSLQAKKDRIEYWISKGVSLTPTVNNLLIMHNVIQGEKVKAWKPKQKEAAASTGSGQAAPVPAPTA